ncbi:MAG: hypothetical protein M0Q27_03315 [Candidatus Colwellbacteria bacterium]|nr:hypothetical protein [Candidatus Colwellbacteria bacterium]
MSIKILFFLYKYISGENRAFLRDFLSILAPLQSAPEKPPKTGLRSRSDRTIEKTIEKQSKKFYFFIDNKYFIFILHINETTINYLERKKNVNSMPALFVSIHGFSGPVRSFPRGSPERKLEKNQGRIFWKALQKTIQTGRLSPPQRGHPDFHPRTGRRPPVFPATGN